MLLVQQFALQQCDITGTALKNDRGYTLAPKLLFRGTPSQSRAHSPCGCRLVGEHKLVIHPVVGELQGHLDPAVRTEPTLLRHLLPVAHHSAEVRVRDLRKNGEDMFRHYTKMRKSATQTYCNLVHEPILLDSFQHQSNPPQSLQAPTAV